MVLLSLECAIVGQEGTFDVKIDGGEKVSALKDAIKKAKMYQFPADELQLFLAKREKNDTEEGEAKEEDAKVTGWMDEDWAKHVSLDEHSRPQGLEQMKSTLWLKNAKYFGENFTPGEGQVHVLVVIPSVTVTRPRDWFADPTLCKKRKVSQDDFGNDRVIRFFRMANFPPMAHPEKFYTTVVERDSSLVIFKELMQKVKLCFDDRTGGNMLVTGNPGVGKSRLYLYFIFQLVRRHEVEVQQLSSFVLVLNFESSFHKYCAEDDTFVELNEMEARHLSVESSVLRLIEGNSSQLTGWGGVSILFASPGLGGLNNYLKTRSFEYIVPTWSLDELQDYNSLLSDVARLSDDVLIPRYNKFGGIPRFVYTLTESENTFRLEAAITSADALDVISYVKRKQPVRDNHYSHRVLEMVPTENDFRADFHLDFLSKYIAEQIVSRVTEDSIRTVSKFAIAHAEDDSGSTSVVRGKIYEMLCHKWFSLDKRRQLSLRPLVAGGTQHWELNGMPMVRFSSLDDITTLQNCAYYRPISSTFGALDAFIMVGNDCFGLQMTINRNHGIKAAPLNAFLEWLASRGIEKHRFDIVFVVPSDLAGSFKEQTIRTKTGSITRTPGDAARVNQYVVAVDVFAGGSQQTTL